MPAPHGAMISAPEILSEKLLDSIHPMITSKQLLGRTGISRATLNNYVALGILPTPSVRKPTAPHERARRLGYFPDDAVERIETVRRLNAEGLSIDEIADRLPPGCRRR